MNCKNFLSQSINHVVLYFFYPIIRVKKPSRRNSFGEALYEADVLPFLLGSRFIFIDMYNSG